MKNYTVVDATGAILGTACLDDAHLTLNGGTNRIFIEGFAPDPAAKWNSATQAWVLPASEVVLASAKAQGLTQLKVARIAADAAGFTWNGHTFDSDQTSIIHIGAAVIAANAAIMTSGEWSTDWTLADNSSVTLSATDMVEVGAACQAFLSSHHYIYRQFKIAIAAETTVDGVQKYQWPSDAAIAAHASS